MALNGDNLSLLMQTQRDATAARMSIYRNGLGGYLKVI